MGLKSPTSLWSLCNVPENDLPILSVHCFSPLVTAFAKLPPEHSALPTLGLAGGHGPGLTSLTPIPRPARELGRGRFRGQCACPSGVGQAVTVPQRSPSSQGTWSLTSGQGCSNSRVPDGLLSEAQPASCKMERRLPTIRLSGQSEIMCRNNRCVYHIDRSIRERT